ncbi:MAG TPA: hypothetical protein VLG69_00030 [Candidatus Andersenbacteria bacterium]|nr:hypothetical protein [Candidatus Andersenbacteria bacterium]
MTEKTNEDYVDEHIVHSEEWSPNQSAQLAAKRLTIFETLTSPYAAFGAMDGNLICEAESFEELHLKLEKILGSDYEKDVVIHTRNDPS